MYFSPPFKASSLSVASPDGQWVATPGPCSIQVRSTQTLRSANPVNLPPGLSATATALSWSPSSARLLVTVADDLYVLSVTDSPLVATIKNPVSGSGKPSFARFGYNDDEIIAFSTFGLKVLVFSLVTSKAVEIGSPKWYNPASASRGYSIRTQTGHLALLTRVGGRDLLSIHSPGTRQLQRSWHPETNDAQAVTWTPDGQWLLTWDTATHGRRLLLYTPDGQLFRTLDGPGGQTRELAHLNLGIRLCKFSPDGRLCAVCDHSTSVAILNSGSWSRDVTLTHPSTITPSPSVQVWQEQLKGPSPTFIRASQSVLPPTPVIDGKAPKEVGTGCSSAQFDVSSNLLATKLDDSPTTLWIWDLVAAELRAVLIFHANVDFQWHPSIRELLLVTYHDETHQVLPFLWDPLSDGPTFIHHEERVSERKLASRAHATWLDTSSDDPVLLLSDGYQYCLVSLSDGDNGGPYWQDNGGHSTSITVSDSLPRAGLSRIQDQTQYVLPRESDEDTSMLDDTFSFKRT